MLGHLWSLALFRPLYKYLWRKWRYSLRSVKRQ